MPFSRLRILYWSPRLLAILFALFISIFALDTFQESNSILTNTFAFLIHLLPTYLILIALAVAWRRPRIGGLSFIALGLLYIIIAGDFPLTTYLLISGPLFVIGVLFLACCHFHPEKVD